MSTPATTAPLKHAWKKCITQGMASEFLRDDVQAQYRFLQKEIGYRHIRFHCSFHDDLAVVERDANGKLVFCWALLDKVYDFLVEVGFDPIVEFNPMPKALASGETTMFFYKMNVTPPQEMAEWEELIEAVTRHWIERYGLPRVKNWLFEVWNEPNLGSFWDGSQEDYFQLYAGAARAVKRIDPELKIGGPASAGTEMPLPLAKWCQANDVPLDFLSYHNYPMGEYGTYPRREGSPHAPGMCFVNEFKKTKDELEANGFGDLPRIVTEWNVQHCDAEGKTKWVGNADTVRHFSGAAALHYVHHTEPYVDVFGWWTGSDIITEAAVISRRFGGERTQGYGIIDLNGKPKAGYHAFYFLSRLTGPLYDIDLGERPELAHGYVTDETVTTRALLWNFHMPEFETKPWSGKLTLPVPESLRVSSSARVITAQVVEGQGSAYEVWKAMGEPTSLTKLETQALDAAAAPRYRVHVLPIQDGQVVLPYRIGRDEVLFAELSALEEGRVEAASSATDALNQALEYPEDD